MPGAARTLAKVRFLVLDFDGVLTDNRVLVMRDGTEGVFCNRSDGLGIEMLRTAGFPAMVISKELNPVVSARCRKLKLDCVQGCDDKLSELKRQAEARSFTADQIAYVGNDINDLEPMGWVGVPIAVADAHPRALGAAKLVTTLNGGHGAVREVVEWILESRGASA